MGHLFKQVVLFGDSITQFSFDPSNKGFGAALANDYQRKADVLNRGFSGYNTEWAIPILKQLLPTTTTPAAPIILLTIFFGANDAALPFSVQHVPLPRFEENLRTLISFTTDSSSPWFDPSTNLLLITPPPLDEAVWAEHRRQEHQPLDRKAKVTAQYAKAVKEVGQQVGIPVVDLWGEIMARVDGDMTEKTCAVIPDGDSGLDVTATSEHGADVCPAETTLVGCKLMDFLSDGLHLSAYGNEFLHLLILAKIRENYPEIEPDRLPQILPWWRDVDAKNPETSLCFRKN